MRILFIGDIVGRPGRDVLRRALPGLRHARDIDLVVANAENAAGGSGLTPALYREIIAAGVDAITLGDHVYRRGEIIPLLEREENIVRPGNLPPTASGRSWVVVADRNGNRAAIFTLLGQLFMQPVDSPWIAADRILNAIPSDVKVRLLDFHAEATSEMQLMGRYLDGRVSAVLGTHTHVPTADQCIFPGGTAFQCDVGMTGPYDSIIGRRVDRIMENRLTGHPTQFEVATGDPRLCGALVEVDNASGTAISIDPVVVTLDQADELARAIAHQESTEQTH